MIGAILWREGNNWILHQTRNWLIFHRSCQGTKFSYNVTFLHKAITFNVANIRSLKQLRSGDILIEVADSKQKNCESALNLEIYKLRYRLMAQWISAVGVISERDLFNVPMEDNCQNSDHVCGVQKIAIRSDGGGVLPSKRIVLPHYHAISLPLF